MDRTADRQAFEAVHNVKRDAVRLSGDIDIIGTAGSREAFIARYHEFLDRYADSTNENVRKFAADIKNILSEYEDALNAAGIWADASGRLSLTAETDGGERMAHTSEETSKAGQLMTQQADTTVPADTVRNKTADLSEDRIEEAFHAINKALLSAEVNMERLIPKKYVSYDAKREYRVLQQAGNIYSKNI